MRVGAVLICAVFLVSCSTRKLGDYSASSYSIDTTIQGNALDTLISPYKLAMDAMMSRVIGYADSALVKYQPESPLGNFAADVVFKRGLQYAGSNQSLTAILHKTLCLLNFGGLRAPINSGPVTVGNIYELMPFDNTIVIVEMRPAQVIEMLDYVYTAGGQPVSNVSMILSADKKALFINEVEYLFDLNVHVITSDYLADGGDKMTFFADPVRRYDTGILIRDALLEYIEGHDRISSPHVGNRVKIVN